MELIRNLKVEKNSVELWAKQVQNFCKNPLTQEQSEALIKLMFFEKEFNKKPEVLDLLNDNKNGGFCFVIYKRCDLLGVKLSPSVAYFLGAFVCESFGDCTMISAYLKYKAFEHKQKEIDMNFFSVKCFPFGFPTKNDWNLLWDSQKVDNKQRQNMRKSNNIFGSDNVLDYNVCYESLNF